MPLSWEHAAMKKKAVPKNEFSLFEINSNSGILKINVPNFGTSTIAESTKVKAYAYSLSVIGLNSTFGNISDWKTFPLCRSILQKKDPVWKSMVTSLWQTMTACQRNTRAR